MNTARMFSNWRTLELCAVIGELWLVLAESWRSWQLGCALISELSLEELCWVVGMCSNWRVLAGGVVSVRGWTLCKTCFISLSLTD